MARAVARDLAWVRVAWASEDPAAVQLAEEPGPAALVEDRQAGKEHREFEKSWTS
jgi:hypothetical protein